MNSNSNSEKLQDYENARMGVYGYGTTGHCLVEYLEPVVEELVVMEDDPETVEEGRRQTGETVKWIESPQVLPENLDYLITSPGIPGDRPVLMQAREKGTPVLGELELAFRINDTGTFWAITGTNGKSTCADLAGGLLSRKYGEDSVRVCGNRGSPLIRNVLEAPADSHFVVEVSSFQVEGLIDFQPDAGLLTSLGDDHQDYHDSIYEYHSLKWNLLRRVRPSGPLVVPIGHEHRAWMDDYSKLRSFDRNQVRQLPLKFTEQGEFQVGDSVLDAKEVAPALELFSENVLGVLALVWDELDEEKMVDGLRSFESLDYRAGEITRSDGRRVINDSKGTNPAAVSELLGRLNQPVNVLLGGEGKNADFTELVQSLKAPTVKTISIAGDGSAADEMEGLCEKHELEFRRFEDWETAVKSVYRDTAKGETIVLSPGGTSFDAFENYRERGRAFDRWIEEASDVTLAE